MIHGKGVAGDRFFRAGSVDGSIDGADYTEVEQLLQWNGTLSTEISAREATSEIQIQIQIHKYKDQYLYLRSQGSHWRNMEETQSGIS